MLSHRLLSATLCLASTAAASLPPNAALPGAFPPSDCAFLLTDASGASYAYDLTPIAGQNFSISVGPYVYYIATCGISPWACTPSHAESWPYAPLVQSDPKTASGSCWDPAHSTEVPCSDYCEIAGEGPPLWHLPNPSNASILTSAFASVRTQNGGNLCPYDPISGTELGRSASLTYTCDSSLPKGTIAIDGVSESPPCTYNVALRTAAACPTKVAHGPPAGWPLPTPPPGGCSPPAGMFASYLCAPTLTDASGAAWHFDLSSLYRRPGESDYTVSLASGSSIDFNICGWSSASCTPPYSVATNYGAAVQTLEAPPPAGAECTFTNASAAPCTSGCEVLGAGGPLYALPASVPAGGGLVLTFAGVRSLPDDPFPCPSDPHTGIMGSRSWALLILCEASLRPGQLVVANVTEEVPCQYVATAWSSAGCGVAA